MNNEYILEDITESKIIGTLKQLYKRKELPESLKKLIISIVKKFTKKKPDNAIVISNGVQESNKQNTSNNGKISDSSLNKQSSSDILPPIQLNEGSLNQKLIEEMGNKIKKDELVAVRGNTKKSLFEILSKTKIA